VKIGDLVSCKDNGAWSKGRKIAIVVSEIRHGVNSSFVDILVRGTVIPANIRALKVIHESR